MIFFIQNMILGAPHLKEPFFRSPAFMAAKLPAEKHFDFFCAHF